MLRMKRCNCTKILAEEYSSIKTFGRLKAFLAKAVALVYFTLTLLGKWQRRGRVGEEGYMGRGIWGGGGEGK